MILRAVFHKVQSWIHFCLYYVNDLPEAVEVSRVKQYADDTTIYHTSDSPEGLVEGLSKDLAGVDSWIQRNIVCSLM